MRDLAGLESAIAQPQGTFGNADLYPTVAAKATALCFSLVRNHPFVDGNKRIGHAAMETFLILNGFRLEASVDDQESLMLGLADGSVTRDALLAWLEAHAVPDTRPA